MGSGWTLERRGPERGPLAKTLQGEKRILPNERGTSNSCCNCHQKTAHPRQASPSHTLLNCLPWESSQEMLPTNLVLLSCLQPLSSLRMLSCLECLSDAGMPTCGALNIRVCLVDQMLWTPQGWELLGKQKTTLLIRLCMSLEGGARGVPVVLVIRCNRGKV